MTDDLETEGNSLNIPITEQKEVVSITMPSKETITPTQNSKNMEVHHSGHHSHEKKDWKTYFWEFLMLFFAVFCGFLAEYQLEHKIEGNREEVYIKSMIEDLQNDTICLTSVIKEFKLIDTKLDTVLMLYPKFSSGYNDTIHRNISAAKSYPDFLYSDRTMQQLKHSGAMRLIRNKKVADGIANYDSKVKDLIDIDIVGIGIEYYNIRDLMHKLVDNEDLLNDLKIKSKSQMEKGTKNYLLSNDKALLGEFNNSLRDIKYVYNMVAKKESIINNDAKQLIALMKEEYELE